MRHIRAHLAASYADDAHTHTRAHKNTLFIHTKLLIWAAISRYIRAHLAAYYADDNAVAADGELAAYYTDLLQARRFISPFFFPALP